MIEWLPILIFPLCGLVAVVVITLVQRGRELDDQGLLISFAVVFSLALLGCFGLLRTQWVQEKLDPALKQATDLHAHPAFIALETYYPNDVQSPRDAILADLAAGASVTQALQKARPKLAKLGRDRLGFASEQARIGWGQAELQALRELKVRDVNDCAALAGSQGDYSGFSVLGSGLSAENHQLFEAAFVQVLTTADAGMRRELPPPSQNLELGQVQARYVELRAPLAQRYGEEVINYLERRRFEIVAPYTNAQVLCDFRTAQLETILKEPPAMAARLLDSAMR